MAPFSTGLTVKNPMASKATIIKAELQVSDMDRHYYAAHNLTLTQHRAKQG